LAHALAGRFLRLTVGVIVAAFALWGAAAIWIDGPARRGLAGFLAAESPFDWRLLANGYLDRMLYERGTVDTSLPFGELRARSDVTERAKACGDRADFSRCIREGSPAPAARRR
jgi:hypothetical protein